MIIKIPSKYCFAMDNAHTDCRFVDTNKCLCRLYKKGITQTADCYGLWEWLKPDYCKAFEVEIKERKE